MSVTDTIKPKPYLEVANGILSIQKCAIEMASFGAKKGISIWIEPVDEYTMDYLSAYFSTSIQTDDRFKIGNYLLIKNDFSSIYVQLKQD